MTSRTSALLLAVAVAHLTGCSTDQPAKGEAHAAEPAAQSSTAPSREIDWKAVEQAMGRTSVVQPGDVHRFNMARGDLSVTVEGVHIKPPFALGSWVAFKATSDGAIAMGDLVLKESEVAPVMSRLQESGIEQTAVHHHLLRESPRLIYMHVHAHGDAVTIATGVRAALALTSTPGEAPAAPSVATDPGIDTAGITAALGRSGKMNGGVYQVSVPRSETIRDDGMEIPPSMGLATAINFQPTGGGKAAITGDFVMIASEVNPVIRALRENGIVVNSLHNHLLSEEPRLFFMHFWANDDAVKLARSLRVALDRTASRSPDR